MYIQQLSLINYKNFDQADLSFSEKLNCFIGNNGVGKTNLLDAIYYLSFCKSYFTSIEGMNIKHDTDFFVIQGTYSRSGSTENIYCGLKKQKKKLFKRNDKAYKKLAQHIGLLPLVMVSPADINLIIGGSDERRRFMDGVISQYDKQYLDTLLKYNRVINQRNILLKQFAEKNYFDNDSLEIWDEQLAHYGSIISNKRKHFIEDFLPVFQNYYSSISEDKESVNLKYTTQLDNNDFLTLIAENRPKDRVVKYSTVGTHKDDLDFYLGNYSMRKLGSQGQQKTFLIALKLAQYAFIQKVSGLKPILLLDDIFDKLDAHRVKQIIAITSSKEFGQIFVTDTNREHLDQIIQQVGTDYRIFAVENGTVEYQDEKK